MKIVSACSTLPDEYGAADEAYGILSEKMHGIPQFMLVHSSCNYDNEKLIRHLHKLAPDVPLQGGLPVWG